MSLTIKKSVSAYVNVEHDVDVDIQDVVKFIREYDHIPKCVDVLKKALGMPNLSDSLLSQLNIITDLDRQSKLELFLSNIDRISHDKLKSIING